MYNVVERCRKMLSKPSTKRAHILTLFDTGPGFYVYAFENTVEKG